MRRALYVAYCSVHLGNIPIMCCENLDVEFHSSSAHLILEGHSYVVQQQVEMKGIPFDWLLVSIENILYHMNGVWTRINYKEQDWWIVLISHVEKKNSVQKWGIYHMENTIFGYVINETFILVHSYYEWVNFYKKNI